MFREEFVPPPIESPRPAEEEKEPMSKPEPLLPRRTAAEQEENSFRFYTPRRMPKEYRNLKEKKIKSKTKQVERMIADRKKDVMEYRHFEKNSEKNPEIAEELEGCKSDIIEFAAGIGVDLTMDRFPSAADIYLHDEIGDKGTEGQSYWNEMELKGSYDKTTRISRALHELIHMASRKKIYVDALDAKHISSGLLMENGGFGSLNEGLTEMTAQQIMWEKYDGIANISYKYQLMFIGGLVKDITDRLNGKEFDPAATRAEYFQKGSVRKEGSPAPDPERQFTEKEILGYFQAGMFDGDRRCLRIIADIYGAERFRALSQMGEECEENCDLAESFGLHETARQMEKYACGYNAKLDMGGQIVDMPQC